MKKALLYLLSAFIITGNVLAASAVKDKRNVKGFTRISYGVSGNLTVRIGNEFSVVLEGEEDDVERVVTEVSGDRLIIRQENWRFRFSDFNDGVDVYITLPELEGLGVSGSGRAEIVDNIKNIDDLSLNVSGSGKLTTAGIEVDNLDCGISGSGNILIQGEGSADRGDISISGSGNYTGRDLEIDHLEVSVSGSGGCICKAGDSLTARISGSGNVTYRGNPRVDARSSGSGHIRSAD
jgi:predicted SpoU family rRNA methylase